MICIAVTSGSCFSSFNDQNLAFARHPEKGTGVVSNEMLWGVENKHRFGDAWIVQPFELCYLKLNNWREKSICQEALSRLNAPTVRLAGYVFPYCLGLMERRNCQQASMQGIRTPCPWYCDVKSWDIGGTSFLEVLFFLYQILPLATALPFYFSLPFSWCRLLSILRNISTFFSDALKC